jgi:hypothetical protein
MSKKAHMLKAWTPTHGTIGRLWKLAEVGFSGKSSGNWDCTLEGDYETPVSFSFHFCFPAIVWGFTVLHTFTTMCHCRPKARELINLDQKTTKLFDKINIFSYVLIVLMRESWLTQPQITIILNFIITVIILKVDWRL